MLLSFPSYILLPFLVFFSPSDLFHYLFSFSVLVIFPSALVPSMSLFPLPHPTFFLLCNFFFPCFLSFPYMYPSSLLLYFFPSLCHYFFFLSLLPSLLSFVFGYFSPLFLPSLVSLTSYPYTYPCSIGNLGRLSGVHVRGAMLTQHVHVSQSVVQLKQFHTCVRGFVNIDVLSCERGCLNAVFTGSSSHV